MSNTCKRCGRSLKNKESQDRGCGLSCAIALGIIKQKVRVKKKEVKKIITDQTDIREFL